MINVRLQQTPPATKLTPTIKVIGVGGAGGNAVNNMIESGLQGAEFIVCNTDAQALSGSAAENKIQLGANVTAGLGAGAKPEIGRMAAEETLDDVMAAVDGANMVFVTAGMGGGTGTGAAPVIAKACRELDILTVGVVTKPFHFEGSMRMRMAEEGIKELQDYVDTLIVIPNQNLFRIANEKTTFSEAFRMADTVLQSGVRGVTDLIVSPGLINLDFADIRSIMLEMGKAVMGTGDSTGDRRAIEAAEKAISNPLLDDMSMKGAKGVIINVTGGSDMTLFEADEACNRIRDEVDPEANIIFGTSFDDSMDGSMRVSIVATGIDKEEVKKTRPLGMGGVAMERARPKTTQTPVASRSYTPAAATVATQSAPVVQQQVQAQAQPKVQQQVQQVEQDVTGQTETDLFDQQQQVTQNLVQEAQVNQQDVTGNGATQAEELRGMVHGESFIPPMPATAQHYEAHQQRQAQTGAASASLKLNPPVPGANRPKRTPSLFERITGGAFSHDTQDEFDGAQTTATTSGETTTGETGSGSTGGAVPASASQGRLNIGAASAAPSVEDELDIPAFLRRQAN